MSDQERVCLSILPSLSDRPFPNSHAVKVFMILAVHLFCFALAWKDNATVHISKAIAKRAKSNLKDSELS